MKPYLLTICGLGILGLLLFFQRPALSREVIATSSAGVTTAIQPDGIEWIIDRPFQQATLVLQGPGAWRQSWKLAAGRSFDLSPANLPGNGLYTVEIQFRPVVDPALLKEVSALDDPDRRQARIDELRASGRWPAPMETFSSTFRLENGRFVVPVEETPTASDDTRGQEAVQDFVIADDLIVQGSTCTGLDCVNNENFGFDTLRLKENNTRLKFEDTSATAGFPTNDWQLTANDSGSGGAEKFSIDDITNSKTPFTIRANAPNNAFFLATSGHLGLGTASPVVDVHAVNGNTPAMRLEQDGSSGFSLQTWDLAGNEANFFIRDVTNGSKLPFRIQPNTPSDSLFLRNTGQIGMGTSSPTATLHIRSATPTLLVQSTAASNNQLLHLDSNGNLTLGGLLVEASDAGLKENFLAVDPDSVLERVSALPLYSWNYIGDGPAARHIGPTAQDFYEAFGFGRDNRHIAPLDVNGVSLAAIQALNSRVSSQAAEIEALRAENADLAARLSRLETILNELLAAQKATP